MTRTRFEQADDLLSQSVQNDAGLGGVNGEGGRPLPRRKSDRGKRRSR